MSHSYNWDNPPPMKKEEAYWVAGFIEGDGCFTHSGKKWRVRVCQKQVWPLTVLVKLVGGTISHYWHDTTVSSGPIYDWSINGSRAVELMILLRPLMSPDRQAQIDKCVTAWENR